MHRNKRMFCIAFSIGVAGWLLPAAGTLASMIACSEYVLDLTKPQHPPAESADAHLLTARWSRPDRIQISDAGLGWDGAANAYYDTWIETCEPIGVGWSWRPVQSVMIQAEVELSVVDEYRGTLFVRHSPDAEHWSCWIPLARDQAPAGAALPGERSSVPAAKYKGTVGVPYRDREPYYELLRKYAEQDAPWKSDEEAAVGWILAKDPAYFEKSTPFVGYLQFLYETQLAGNCRIRGMKIQLTYSAGGTHLPPADPKAWEGRDGPWRFRASSPSPAADSVAAEPTVDAGHAAVANSRLPDVANDAMAWGEAHDGLRIGVSASGETTPELRVALENVGDNDLVLNLGIMFANGRTQIPEMLRFTATGPGHGPARTLRFLTPPVSGRLDPMVVPLPCGARYVLTCPLYRYAVFGSEGDAGWGSPGLAPGSYELVAEYEGRAVEHTNSDTEGLALMPCWTGIIRSTAVKLTIPATDPSPLDPK
jgi:hypothetical protein